MDTIFEINQMATALAFQFGPHFVYNASMRHRAGFTLVEILVVVAIVAGLAALAIPNQLRARMVANESSAIGNLGALMGALDMYRNVHQVFPADGTWQASMFDNATPDFAPVKFSGDMTAQEIQGYLYTYTRMAGTDGGGYELVLSGHGQPHRRPVVLRQPYRHDTPLHL